MVVITLLGATASVTRWESIWEENLVGKSGESQFENSVIALEKLVGDRCFELLTLYN